MTREIDWRLVSLPTRTGGMP